MSEREVDEGEEEEKERGKTVRGSEKGGRGGMEEGRG